MLNAGMTDLKQKFCAGVRRQNSVDNTSKMTKKELKIQK